MRAVPWLLTSIFVASSAFAEEPASLIEAVYQRDWDYVQTTLEKTPKVIEDSFSSPRLLDSYASEIPEDLLVRIAKTYPKMLTEITADNHVPVIYNAILSRSPQIVAELIKINPEAAKMEANTNFSSLTNTPMKYAAYFSKAETFNVLYEFDKSLFNKQDKAIMMIAAERGSAELLEKILSIDPGLINTTNEDSENVLHRAGKSPRDDGFKYLLTKVPKEFLTQKNKFGLTPLGMEPLYGNDVKVVMTVDKYPDLLDQKFKDEKPLREIIRAALKANPDYLFTKNLATLFPDLAPSDFWAKTYSGWPLFHESGKRGLMSRQDAVKTLSDIQTASNKNQKEKFTKYDVYLLSSLGSLKSTDSELTSTEWSQTQLHEILKNYLLTMGDLPSLQEKLSNSETTKNQIADLLVKKFADNYQNFIVNLFSAQLRHQKKPLPEQGSLLHVVYSQILRAQKRIATSSENTASSKTRLAQLESLRDKLRATTEFGTIAKMLDKKLADTTNPEQGIVEIQKGSELYLFSSSPQYLDESGMTNSHGKAPTKEAK